MALERKNYTDVFPAELVPGLIDQTKGRSSLAKLSGQTPIAFNGQTYVTFSMDSEVNLVGESGAKAAGEASLASKTITPIKVEYGLRVSDEFMYASEERKLDILSHFAEGFAKKVARGLDLMAFHGVNPRTGTVSDLIGTNCFDKAVTNSVAYNAATDPDALIESAILLVDEEYDITGMAMSRTLANALGQMKTGTEYNTRLYPDFAFGGTPASFAGNTLDVNSTVNYGNTAHLYAGDFSSAFKWGYAKEIPMEVIPYGDPDNTGSDLKGHNQVYIRAEMYIGWGILVPSAFAKIAVASA